MDNADAYRRTGQLATLGKQLTALAHEMENERDALAERAAGGDRAVDPATLQTRQESVDAAARKAMDAAGKVGGGGSGLRLAVGNVVNRVNDIAPLRKLAERLAPGPIVDKYSEFIADFNGFHILTSQDAPTPELAQKALALADVARAKDAASRERALVSAALWQGRFEPIDRRSVDDARASMNTATAAFRNSATPAQLRLYEDSVTGPELDRAEVTRLQALARADASAQLKVRLGARVARGWTSDATARVDRLRAVEQELAADLASLAEQERSDAESAAVRDGVLLFLVLAIVLVTVIIVARSLVRPLRRLQSGALEVASTRLPGLVDRLRDPEAAAGGIEVEPIDIDSTDEIGQVARAFDEVHREAVRLAADEAVLRGNINAMFVNLSRRSQSLIERQLRLIEELEQSERDEEQLANLFRLDHLATRMRRNCENLLVLGGQEQVRRWNQAVPLIDVVRASLSEVEQYERIALRVQGDMTVAGPVVNDLVHLLAELVENATVFSSEDTKVTVSGQMLSGGGSMLQITDNGVGMSPDELEQANWRLANPPVIDFSAARRMGLFVVGRLAVRHGIRVELRAAQGGGLTAFVVLPDAAVTPGETGGIGTRGLGSREPSGQGRLAALTASGEPPAIGVGGAFRQNDGSGPIPSLGGTGAQPVAGSGAHPMVGGTGPHPMVGGTGPQRPVRGTGPQPMMGETGPLPATGGGTGAFPAVGGSGSFPAVGGTGAFPAVGGSGAHRAVPGTGAQPIVPPGDPYAGDDRQPPRRPGELPVRQPGAQLPGRPAIPSPEEQGQPNGLFQPRSERMQGRQDTGGGNGLYRPGRHTAPQSVVPEAQPILPEHGAPRQIPWETGPLQQVGGGTGPQPAAPYADGSPSGAQPQVPDGGAPWGDIGDPAAPDAARPDDPTVTAPNLPEDAVPEPPRPEPSGYEHPVQGALAQPAVARPPAAQAPPQGPPQAQRPKAPPRVPERSPIFDAMQSEWFQRRSGGAAGEDPAKGWESPADAGFRAAEAAQEPVQGARTAVGLPKRVPGKNRIPGAVGRQANPALSANGQGPAAPAQGGPASQAGQDQAGQGPSGEGGPAQGQASGQPADVVRNRFSSLQRGVHRGRNEARGGGTSGEAPSQGDDETGGTR
ncbi:HAMP domain-containing protein [Actinomadura rubrisoli]|uniref:histidine kinase n=2 Tax=Actinomadura rubrisoli TaxID=2530368 RepID=A0A4V6PEU6_9ACTN|nr:HAMP domain-containing protein [Actinomadura rubrisoli]